MPSNLPPIALITAGAGGMICGSCLNDNALARELVGLGLDVQLIPTYTPIRTDETDVSIDRVFFGGINVYLEQKVPWWGKLPSALRSWLDRPTLIRRLTSGQLKTDARLLGPMAVSMLRGEAGYQRAGVLQLVRWLADELRPGLVQLSNVLIAGFVPALKRGHDVPVLVSLQGDDIFLSALPDSHRSQALAEIQRLDASIDGYLVHSAFYADFMAEFLSVSRDKFHRVPLGVQVDDFQPDGLPVPSLQRPPDAPRPKENSGPVTIGYLARLAPEKGLDRLCQAFCELKRQPETSATRLRIAGWLGADQRDYAQAAFQQIHDAGFGEAMEYVGEVDRAGKCQFLRSIDLLCVPAPYREPKGLYVLEAWASGVPVVLPDHGAFPELIASTGGGILFTAGQQRDLVDRLTELITQPALRAALGRRGLEGVRRNHTSAAMAAAVRGVYEQMLTASAPGRDA